MKNLLISFLIASTSLCAMADTLPMRVIGTPPEKTVTNPMKAMRPTGPERKRTPKATSVIDGRFTLDRSKGQVVYVFIAVPSNSVVDGYYESDYVTATNHTIDVPAGTYDLMAIIEDDDAAETIILIKEDVEVSGETSVEFDSADAIYTTRISHTDSEGTRLILPSRTEVSNSACGDFIDLVTHNGAMAWAGETLAYMECNYLITTNNPNSRFSFLRSDILAAETESATMIIPIDFNKEVCGPTSSAGWQSRRDEFAITPFMQKFYEYYPYDRDYTFLIRALVINDQYWGVTGLGVFDMKCDSQRVAIWAPDDYNGELDVMLTQINNVFSGDDSAVQGMFLKRGENGLTQLGLNMPFSSKVNLLARTSNSESVAREFSRYSGVPQDGVRANATPLLLACNSANGFLYSYKGRYGEELSLDSYNILNSYEDAANLEKFGGNPSDVKIYADGKLICSSINDLPWNVDWIEGATNRAEVEMHNVLIDGKIPGYNSAVIEWNAQEGTGFAPTFTSMQFRDTDDKITDRFENPEDGVIEFTVGDLAMGFNEAVGYYYYDIEEVKSVSASYAPHGSSEFTPIEVNEIPELFFTPGYGYFYRGSLANIDRCAVEGWFDLKLRAEDSDGAYIEQIISPAFNIASLSGIENMAAEKNGLYTIDGKNIIVSPGTKIFTTDGKQCSGNNLERGIYIITDGNKAAKVAI